MFAGVSMAGGEAARAVSGGGGGSLASSPRQPPSPLSSRLPLFDPLQGRAIILTQSPRAPHGFLRGGREQRKGTDRTFSMFLVCMSP